MNLRTAALVMLLLGSATVAGVASANQPGGLSSTNSQASTAFTYQGQLKQSGGPVSGTADLQFKLFDSAAGGVQVGSTVNALNTAVSNGVFTAVLDFGQAFTGNARWIEMSVRYPAGSGSYTTLAPRQAATATPYALGLAPGASVDGASAQYALRGQNLGTGPGLLGVSNGGNGVQGTSTAAGASGVYGESTAAEGIGVAGRDNAQSGIGVFGEASGPQGVAISGITWDPSAIALRAENIAGGVAASLLGQVLVTGQTDFYGPTNIGGGFPLSFGASLGQMINLWDTAYGVGVQDFTFYSRSGSAFAWFQGGSHSNTQGDPGPGGTRLMYTDSNGRLETRNGVWAKGLAGNSNPLTVTGTNDSDTEFRVTNVGEVFADGSFHSGGADFAELLPAKRGLEPADVLVIGKNGELERSNRPYQTNVVGVYSTQPCLTGGSTGENEAGKVPLAVVGVVPVKVTDEGGAITPGDFLTTSSRSGHAMKARPSTDAEGRESYPGGSIIGKALTSLKSGTGTVTVLLVAK